jgi:hypothetical protein
MQAMTTEFATEFADEINQEDWFSLGKADAWAGQPKRSPQQDPLADSLYDLGYSEGLSHCWQNPGKSPIPLETGNTQTATGHG